MDVLLFMSFLIAILSFGSRTVQASGPDTGRHGPKMSVLSQNCQALQAVPSLEPPGEPGEAPSQARAGVL